MAAIVAWMAIWWISEAVPLAVTSLLPLVLFPMFGIDGVAGTAVNYGKEIIFLFLGGFLLALAMERSGLHRRIALRVVRRVGGTGPRLITGIMLSTALLSMWMNSTSCVLVMLPIALSLLDGDGDPELRGRLTVPLLLAVAYGATIGGMATPVGTPPNLVFMELWRDRYPQLPPIGFGRWMAFGVPLMVVYLGVVWWLLTRVLFRVPRQPISTPAQVQERLRALGPFSAAERLAALVFAGTALLWITGDDIALSEQVTFRGWRSLTGCTDLTDGAVALLGALILFLVPLPRPVDQAGNGPPYALLDWKYAEANVPWGVLLLFGGGFALAHGIDESGLSVRLVATLQSLQDLPHPLLIAAVSGLVCVLSELGSNTAVASLTLPLLAQSTDAWGVAPETVLIPATLAATLGFALPVASPMQAIVFGSGRIPVRQMVRAGIWVDLVGIALITMLFS